MLRHKPSFAYSGLTIILDKPSRFDDNQLLSGIAGSAFEGFLNPISRFQCDIRLSSDPTPFIEGTKVILALGEKSLELFKLNPGNKEGAHLDNYRGTPVKYGDITVIASFTPQDSFDRRDYSKDEDNEDKDDTTDNGEKGHQKTKRRNWRFWLYQDTRKAVRILRSGLCVAQRTFSYDYFPSADFVIKELSTRNNEALFIDIETDKQQNLTCFGYSFGNSEVVHVVPWKRYTGELAYAPEDCRKIIQAIAKAFRDNVVVCHNGSFDWFVFAYKYRVAFPRKPHDTMVAWHRCYPEIEKSLGHLISYFTDCEYHKSDGVFDPKNAADENNLWVYNGKDVSRMRMVYEGLQQEIIKLGATASVNQAMASIRPYLTVMFKGMRIDTEKFIKKFDECEARSEQLERCLKIITGRNLNPRSSQQVSKYLYEDLGLPCPDDEQPTKEETLLKLLTKKECPSVKVILAIRGERKLASSLKFRLWNNGYDNYGGDGYDRLTCAYVITGTDTFRLGSRKLLKFRPDPGYGTNCQNWDSFKSNKRSLVIADKGKVLGQTDQAGADAVIVAYGCVRNGHYRSLFLNGIKPHIYVAMQLFKEHWATVLDVKHEDFSVLQIPELPKYKYWKDLVDIIKKDEVKYYIGKKSGHSFNYDQGPNTFQTVVLKETEGVVVIPLADCKAYRQLYKYELFPEIPEWHVKVQEEIKSKRKLANLFGFERRFHQPFGDELWRQGYAFNPQSTVGSITNIAITELQERLEQGDELLNKAAFDILQNGHDSILWQANEDYALDVAKIVKEHLGKQFTHNGVTFKMGSETKIGYNWWSHDEVKNPSGMKEVKI